MTIDRYSWGYRRNANVEDFLSIHELLEELVTTVSYGGNLLMNVGPTKEGTIAPIFQERLRQMGEWLGNNGDGIYGTKPWTHQEDTLTTGISYTTKDSAVYVIFRQWPDNNTLTLGSIKDLFSKRHVQVTMLGSKQIDVLRWNIDGDKVHIILPSKDKILNLKWAWTLKIKT